MCIRDRPKPLGLGTANTDTTSAPSHRGRSQSPCAGGRATSCPSWSRCPHPGRCCQWAASRFSSA
eukprot:11153483-Alexandrium_andersonii.AAC.1